MRVMALPVPRFQSTLPARGATNVQPLLLGDKTISIHAPRTGSDAATDCLLHRHADFNPRSPHGERPRPSRLARLPSVISIHAPRTGSDRELFTIVFSDMLISIHAPRTGSDGSFCQSCHVIFVFQSTLPARGATRLSKLWKSAITDFNPRSPHGERPAKCRLPARPRHFNPRSPHGERQDAPHCQRYGKADFNPRSPHGERLGSVQTCTPGSHFNPRSPHGERPTNPLFLSVYARISIHAPRTGSDADARHGAASAEISIHAPRTGSDRHGLHGNAHTGDFNPRSPHGERRTSWESGSIRRLHFNPRSPHGERLRATRFSRCRRGISIHAPRTGSDGFADCIFRVIKNFNPRSPHGERPRLTWWSELRKGFQSTLPARGATVRNQMRANRAIQFQSTLPARGATVKYVPIPLDMAISIHAPRTGSDKHFFSS